MRLYSRRNPNETKRWATLAALLLVLQATAAAGAEEEGFSTPFAPEFFKEECLRKQQSSHDTDDNDGDPLSTVDEYLGRWVTGLSNPSVFVSSLELLLFSACSDKGCDDKGWWLDKPPPLSLFLRKRAVT